MSGGAGVRRAIAVALIVTGLVRAGLAAAGAVASATTSQQVPGGSYGEFTGLTPARVLDAPIFDVAGYYADEGGTPSARYQSIEPARLFDTRSGHGPVDARPAGPGEVLAIDVTGVAGVNGSPGYVDLLFDVAGYFTG